MPHCGCALLISTLSFRFCNFRFPFFIWTSKCPLSDTFKEKLSKKWQHLYCMHHSTMSDFSNFHSLCLKANNFQNFKFFICNLKILKFMKTSTVQYKCNSWICHGLNSEYLMSQKIVTLTYLSYIFCRTNFLSDYYIGFLP